MPHSTVTSKGQTTIPGEIRKALRIKPGDTLEYAVQGDHATIRVHSGAGVAQGCARQQEGQGTVVRPDPQSRVLTAPKAFSIRAKDW